MSADPVLRDPVLRDPAPVDQAWDDAARRYKDVVGELTAAADALRERDKARAATLARELVDLEKAMVEAADRAARSHRAVEQHRELVLEALADEEWVEFKPRARPDPDADPEQLDALDMAADRAAMAVLEAVRRRFLGFGGG